MKKWPEERKRARARLRRIAKEQSFSHHCHPLEIGDIFVRSYYGQITCSMSIKGFWGCMLRSFKPHYHVRVRAKERKKERIDLWLGLVVSLRCGALLKG